MLKSHRFLPAVILFLCSLVYAENIVCTSDSVCTEFSQQGTPLKTIFEGNVKIIEGDIVMECKRAEFDHSLNQLTIDSGVRFSMKGLSVFSSSLIYNFNSETGSFTDGRFYYEPFYGRAGLIQKEKDTISADTCILTTCDRENPHYHLYCQHIRLTEEKLALKNLKIYLGKIPVFYFPRYSYNVRTKKPLFSISAGYKTELGDGISIIFNNSPARKKNIEMEERIDLGFQGTGAGITIQDSTLYETSSIRKLQSYAFKKYGGYETSFGFIGEFQNEFVNKQNLIVDWRWMKNSEFFRKHLYDLYLEKSKNPNYFSYSRITGEGIFNFRIVDNAYEDFLSPARIPEFEYSLPYVKIRKFYGSFDIVPTRFIDTHGNQLTRIASDAKFDMPFNAGYVKIVPFLGIRNIFYSDDNQDINNFILYPGINLQILAKSSSGKRTVYFSPSLSIYSCYPSKKHTDFSFDNYDFNQDGFFSNLNLAWDFWRDGKHTGNITMMNVYDASRTKFQDSILLWNFDLDKNWLLYGQERFNFSEKGMKEMRNEIVYNGRDISFGIGNSFLSGKFNGITATLDKQFGKWEFGCSLNYDIEKDSFTSQRYYLQRQFHCLKAGIVYSKTSTTYIGFFIMPSAIGLKKS